MTVYKAIKKEADAASAAAIALPRARPPQTTGTVDDTQTDRRRSPPSCHARGHLSRQRQGRRSTTATSPPPMSARAYETQCPAAASADSVNYVSDGAGQSAPAPTAYDRPPGPRHSHDGTLREQPDSSPPLLELRGVNKSFGPVQVLHDVDFAVYPRPGHRARRRQRRRQVHARQVHRGIYPIDSGEILFEGRPVTIHSPRDAAALGIEIVYQDLALCDNLDIVQNMFLGRERANRPRARRAAMELLAAQTRSPSLSVRTVKSVRQTGRQPLRRPAADRRHRQGRAVEHQGRHPRRADRRARRRADPPGARPGPPPRRPGPRRGAHLATT